MLLQERILQTLEKSNSLDQRTLARIAGVNDSSISRYLNGFETINFPSVLKIVKQLYPEQERELMAEYVLTQRSKNARFALEYCEMTNLSEQSKQLIDILFVSVNPVDKEWANMYDLVRIRKNHILKPFELLSKVEVFKPKEIETDVMKSILKAYIYFDLNEHNALSLHLYDIDNKIRKIKSNYIREAFNVRLGLIMSQVYIYANDLEKAREYIHSVLNQEYFDQVRGTAFHQLGYSYMFENYEKSLDYFEKSLDFFVNDIKIKKTKIDISFLKSLWNKEHSFSFPLNDQTENFNFIFYLIQKGDKCLAESCLDKVSLSTLTEWNKAFYYYYKALLTNDITTYYYSVECFIEMNDYFHLYLPLTELKRLGENEIVLKILSNKGNKNEKNLQNNVSQ